MFLKKSIIALSMIASIGLVYAGTESKNPRCMDKKSCLNNPNCECYCSVKCGPRKKTSKDSPIWIENDPHGHHCYCAPRDVALVNQCENEEE